MGALGVQGQRRRRMILRLGTHGGDSEGRSEEGGRCPQGSEGGSLLG